MDVDFWFDPACPWTWLTSRWVTDVAANRDLRIRWRTLSLLLKKQTQVGDPEHERFAHSLGLLRMIEAVRADLGDTPVGALYALTGDQIHCRGNRVDATTALRETGLPIVYAEAVDDPAWDEVIAASAEEVLSLAGRDVGIPLMAFRHGGGDTVAFFGPVISRRLPIELGLQLWDGMQLMTGVPGFWELKRTRTEAPEPACGEIGETSSLR